MNWAPFLEGLVLGASLIIAIGAQNAFVLKQGLKKQHLFLVATTCFVGDSIMVILGVEGIAEILSDFPRLSLYFRWGGAIFLTVYGLRSFYNVFHPHVMVAALENTATTRKLPVFLAALGFTFLNPHAYVDTMLLLGTIGAEHPPAEHLPFILGVLVASFVWFYGLAYGASYLSRYFKNPRTWQILDTIMGFMMIGIAISLLA